MKSGRDSWLQSCGDQPSRSWARRTRRRPLVIGPCRRRPRFALAPVMLTLPPGMHAQLAVDDHLVALCRSPWTASLTPSSNSTFTGTCSATPSLTRIDELAVRAGIDGVARHHDGIGNFGQRNRHIHQLARHQRHVGIGEGGAQFDGAGGVGHGIADEIHRRARCPGRRRHRAGDQRRSGRLRALRAWMRGRSDCGRAKEILIGWIWVMVTSGVVVAVGGRDAPDCPAASGSGRSCRSPASGSG